MAFTVENAEKLVPVLGLFLIFCGVIKIYTYYKFFGLSITPYLKISEVLTLFLENLLTFLSIAFFVSFISLDLFFKLGLEEDDIKKMIELTFFQKLGLILAEMKLSYWFLVLFIIIYAFIYLFRKNIKKHEFLVTIPAFIIGYLIVPILSIFIKIVLIERYNLNLNIIYIYFGLLMASLILFAFVNGLSEAYKVKKYNYFLNSVYEFDDEKITSNYEQYYIGRTEGYLFFFNVKNNKPLVYPASQLRRNYYKP